MMATLSCVALYTSRSIFMSHLLLTRILGGKWGTLIISTLHERKLNSERVKHWTKVTQVMRDKVGFEPNAFDP